MLSSEEPSFSLGRMNIDSRNGSVCWGKLSARIVLSLLVLSCVLWGVDLHDLTGALGRLSMPCVVEGVLAMLASIAMAGLLWYLVFPATMRPTMGVASAIRHTMIGAALNALLPTSGVSGDVYRGWACVQTGTGVAISAGTVIIARWCSLVTLSMGFWLLFIVLGLHGQLHELLILQGPVGGVADEHLLTRYCLYVAILVTLLSLVGTLALLLPALAGLSREAQPLAPSRLLHSFPGSGVARQARRSRWRRCFARWQVGGVSYPVLSNMLIDFYRSPGRLLGALLVSSFALFLEGFSFYCVARAVDASCTSWLFLLLGPPMRLLHQVPGFFNAIGIQDVAVVEAGAFFGLRGDVSLAISLVMHAVRLCVALLGLPLYILYRAPTPPCCEPVRLACSERQGLTGGDCEEA